MKVERVSKKPLNIGLLGLVINNGNMGCLALTYSLIIIFEELSHEFDGYEFRYFVFEDSPDPNKVREMCKWLNIDENRITSIPYKKGFAQLKDMNKCNLIIDFTEGDSFSDIYGTKRFIKNSFYKILSIKSIAKLILGPQTYGPYINSINKYIAKYIIEKSDMVFSRDRYSIDYINEFVNKDVILSTDVAFKLPYVKKTHNHRDRKLIGFNASKLLYFKEYNPSRIKLSLDFREFSYELIKYFSRNDWDVALISHVAGDYIANEELHKKYPSSILIDKFTNPIEAKNFISGLDALVSPRMHSTIAAYSSGVSVVPLSYSRKFLGLYSEIGLTNIINMELMSLDDAMKNTILYIWGDNNRINTASQNVINDRIEVFYNSLRQIVLEIINGEEYS